jgi:hypothetical protein
MIAMTASAVLAPPIVQMVAIATATTIAMRFIVVFRVFIIFFLSCDTCPAHFFYAGLNVLLPPKAEIPLGTHHDCEKYFSKVAVNPFQAPSFFTTADYADDSDKLICGGALGFPCERRPLFLVTIWSRSLALTSGFHHHPVGGSRSAQMSAPLLPKDSRICLIDG